MKNVICVLQMLLIYPLRDKRPYSDFSALYFSEFELNTERYSASLRIQSECGKMRTRISPNRGWYNYNNFSRWFCHSYWCRDISIQMFPICLGWTKFHLKTIKLIDVFKKITKERKKNSCPEKFTSNWFSRFLNNRHCNQGKYTNKANIFFCHSLPGSRSVTN